MSNKTLSRGEFLTGLGGILLGVPTVLSACASFKPSTRLDSLDENVPYILLIGAFREVRELSRLVGFSGNYGHIEAVYNGMALGCRPNACMEIPVSTLRDMFRGIDYEARALPIKGNVSRAIQYFRQQLEGRRYDLFNNNCTDALVKMYEASGDQTRRIYPVNVRETYFSNKRLREYMEEHNIPMPNRDFIYFPDQFEDLGTLVERGTF